MLADLLMVNWFDGRRVAQQPPNPDYPNGVDIVAALGDQPSCWTKLDYPAPRCGRYVVVCPVCNLKVVCTTAGRPDDPRSIRVACKLG